MKSAVILSLLALSGVHAQSRSSTRRSSTRASGTTSAKTTIRSSSTRAAPSTTSTRAASTSASAVPSGACAGTFTAESAASAFANLNPGWNLGNTLDAVPDEGSWNNPPVTADTFDDMKKAGFKSIRIPVTWANHFVSSSPSWTVNTTWMDRVETVVDQVLSRGFYAILNAHHDSWQWASLSASGANYTAIEEQFGRLWDQIGARFKCKSSKLIFEPLNEPAGDTADQAAELNKLNDIFLDRINKAGGFNPKRVVSLGGLGQDSVKTSQWFKRGTTYPDQPWGLQFHYYSPYDFIFSAWGKTIWGSDADKASLDNDLALFKGNFSNIPTFIGEWDASSASTEPAARWKYFDYFIRATKKQGFSTILWDNGNDHFDRSKHVWRDPTAIDILFNAVAGTTNSLADSTEDGAATSQFTSAYLFHKVGQSVNATSVSYLLNGNTLTSITTSTGKTLASPGDYSVSGGVVTFTQSYLSTLLSPTTTPGIVASLTVTFSAGAKLSLQIVQYNTPATPSPSTFKLPADTTSSLDIPIAYQGLRTVAAVKALKADGTYLSDDWTVYLGPLQQARWTYGNWQPIDSGLEIEASGVAAIKATGQSVTLLVEFYPRSVGDNAVNVTITQ